MESTVIASDPRTRNTFKDAVMKILPEGGNLNLCLTCGLCSSGCPASGLEGMDPRRFLRMAALGLDEEILNSKWAWMGTMCQRCIMACPMKIDIPGLVFNVRNRWPKEDQPRGIRGSCELAFKNDTCSAMHDREQNYDNKYSRLMRTVHN